MSSPFDYASWVERARRFTEDLARLPGATIRSTNVLAPATSADLAAVEKELGVPLPGSFRDCFMVGAAGIDCGYVFEPDARALDQVLPDQKRIFGGACLGPLSELTAFSRSAAEWAAGTWVSEEPDQEQIWKAALPFTRMDNGTTSRSIAATDDPIRPSST